MEPSFDTSNLLASLPEDAMAETMSALEPKDLAHLFRASAAAQRCRVADSLAKDALRREGLPGNRIEDLVNHFVKWQEYQELLKNAIFELVPETLPDEMELETGKAKCREFLRSAIHNFTLRVAGAHSWYKHLPIGRQEQVCFLLHLPVNMYHSGGKYIKKMEDDGTRFHYTWLPTDKYRQRYGFFDYDLLQRHVEYQRSVDDLDGNRYRLPSSACGPIVDVTAAVHSDSLYHDLYKHVLEVAVAQGAPDLARGELQPEMFGHMQRRFAEQQGMKLPTEAGKDLERIASRLIAEGELPDNVHHSRDALQAQQVRERKAIALSLRELCLQNFGSELTPTEEEATSFLPL